MIKQADHLSRYLVPKWDVVCELFCGTHRLPLFAGMVA